MSMFTALEQRKRSGSELEPFNATGQYFQALAEVKVTQFLPDSTSWGDVCESKTINEFSATNALLNILPPHCLNARLSSGDLEALQSRATSAKCQSKTPQIEAILHYAKMRLQKQQCQQRPCPKRKNERKNWKTWMPFWRNWDRVQPPKQKQRRTTRRIVMRGTRKTKLTLPSLRFWEEPRQRPRTKRKRKERKEERRWRRRSITNWRKRAAQEPPRFKSHSCFQKKGSGAKRRERNAEIN